MLDELARHLEATGRMNVSGLSRLPAALETR